MSEDGVARDVRVTTGNRPARDGADDRTGSFRTITVGRDRRGSTPDELPSTDRPSADCPRRTVTGTPCGAAESRAIEPRCRRRRAPLGPVTGTSERREHQAMTMERPILVNVPIGSMVRSATDTGPESDKGPESTGPPARRDRRARRLDSGAPNTTRRDAGASSAASRRTEPYESFRSIHISHTDLTEKDSRKARRS